MLDPLSMMDIQDWMSDKIYMRIQGPQLLVLSYAKNIGIRRAISSGNPENLKKLEMIWLPQIKDSLQGYLDLF